MKPTTAVIFAAGTGSRMFPVTSAVQKELLPIGNRPVVDYIVADLVAAGIKRIIFVIRPGQNGLKDYYVGNADLEQRLKLLGKTADLAMLDAIHRQAAFEFVEHPVSAGYGTAIPLLLALPLLNPEEPVVVCGGDDFVWHTDGSSEMSRLIETFVSSGGEGAVTAIELPPAQIGAYHTISTKKNGQYDYLVDFSSDAHSKAAVSNLVNISKYVLNGPLREYVKSVQPQAGSGESFITDAITTGAKTHPVAIHRASGEYLDTGNPESWFRANQVIAEASAKKAR